MPPSVKPLFYLNVLRALAAFAVIVIHVLAPYRQQFGLIADEQWFIATSLNAASRWAVPVFILITGGLFLSDRRPFDLRYFLSRRLSRVVVPFVAWSIFYTWLSGWNPDLSFNTEQALNTLQTLPEQASWYHLGFYYYFIPLYFLIPVLRPLVQQISIRWLQVIILFWLWMTLSYGLRMDSWLHMDLVLYGGYLVLGYYLMNEDTRPWQFWVVLAGVLGVVATQAGVWWLSSANGHYSVGRFLSYRTLNVVLVASMVFILAKHYADRLPDFWKGVANSLSRYSLGIYLIHPLLLWPVLQYELYLDNALLSISFWSVVVLILSGYLTRLLTYHRYTAWLVP